SCVNLVCQPQGGGTWLPNGVQTNFPQAMLTGWTQCYAGTYAQSGVLLAGVLGTCSKAKLFFACRPAGSQSITVGAWIERAKVSLIDGINGAGGMGTSWIFANRSNDYGCWAFVPTGDTLPGGNCNLDSGGATHLSWSNFDGTFSAGYRCGLDRNLN